MFGSGGWDLIIFNGPHIARLDFGTINAIFTVTFTLSRKFLV